MAGRIVTARHGRPDIDRSVRIRARDYDDWWAEYDRSGLVPTEAPPESLKEIARNADYVLSHHAPGY